MRICLLKPKSSVNLAHVAAGIIIIPVARTGIFLIDSFKILSYTVDLY